MMKTLRSRMTTWSRGRRPIIQASIGLIALLLGAFLAPASRASEPWKWRDLSQNIPSSVQTGLNLVAGRGQDWLVSNGSRLWSVNTTEEVADYSDHSRDRGTLVHIASDGSRYLLGFQGPNGPTLTQTDLHQWTDVSEARFPQKRLRRLDGASGRWAILTEDQFEDSIFPRSWQAWWYESATSAFPQSIRLPDGASSFVPGCFKENNGSTMCSGQSALVPVNGEWFLFGGSTETRDGSGRLSQEAHASIWRWNSDHFDRLTNAPVARFMSGIWNNDGHILFATTDAVTNPYAADTYWTFDGQTFKSYKREPLEAGLLSVDTRAVQAAWTGNAWAIVSGKTLVQMQNGAFALEGVMRDLPSRIGGSADGHALIVGQRSDFDATTSQTPSAPSLTLLGRALSSNDASYLMRAYNGYSTRVELANITLVGESTTTINSGDSFIVRVDATSQSSIRSIDLFVNGNRVTTCQSSPCRYTQTYWNTEVNDPREQRVVFTARVTDGSGRMTDSNGFVLMIRKTLSTNPSVTPSTDHAGRMPAGLRWNTDTRSGIGITTWITPSSSQATGFANSETRTFQVAAMQNSGIERIELWVNGTLKETCSHDDEGGLSFCGITLQGSDYQAGSQVFVHARVLANDGKEAWSSEYRFDRQ